MDAGIVDDNYLATLEALSGIHPGYESSNKTTWGLAQFTISLNALTSVNLLPFLLDTSATVPTIPGADPQIRQMGCLQGANNQFTLVVRDFKTVLVLAGGLDTDSTSPASYAALLILFRSQLSVVWTCGREEAVANIGYAVEDNLAGTGGYGFVTFVDTTGAIVKQKFSQPSSTRPFQAIPYPFVIDLSSDGLMYRWVSTSPAVALACHVYMTFALLESNLQKKARDYWIRDYDSCAKDPASPVWASAGRQPAGRLPLGAEGDPVQQAIPSAAVLSAIRR